jgi:hypothetical protein
VSFAAITLCVASQRVFIVVVYFVSDSIRKLLDTPSYVLKCPPMLSGIARPHVMDGGDGIKH